MAACGERTIGVNPQTARSGASGVPGAEQQRPAEATSIATAEARRIRVAAYGADNGLADRPFPTASMVKLFMAEDILHRSRAGLLTLSRKDFALLQAMIRRSDDPAASALWTRFGGGRMVSDVAARYGLRGTRPPARAGQWGLATTTAGDLARFLSLLPVVAHPYDAAALRFWMRAATPEAADGSYQRFGLFGTVGGLPAVEQGWMCCVRGQTAPALRGRRRFPRRRAAQRGPPVGGGRRSQGCPDDGSRGRAPAAALSPRGRQSSADRRSATAAVASQAKPARS